MASNLFVQKVRLKWAFPGSSKTGLAAYVCRSYGWSDLGNPSSIFQSVWMDPRKGDDGGTGLSPQMSENSLEVLQEDGRLSSLCWKCQREAGHIISGPACIFCGCHGTQVHWNLLPGTFSPQVASIDKGG